MPQNWKTYKLKEIANLTTGVAFKSKDYELSGNLKVIRGKNITEGYLRWKDDARFWNHSIEKFEKCLVELDDIVIGMDGSKIGKNRAIIRETDLPSILAQRVGRIQSMDGISCQKYLWQLINNDNFENYIDNIKTGTSIPHISLGQIGEFKVQLPPLPEQKAIAQILSAIDDKIENNLAINKTLEEMAMALYKHWFVDFGPFQDGAFVESELGEIPEGWEVKRIGELYETSSGGTPSRKKMEYYENGEIPWIKSKELNNTFITNTEEKINPLGLQKSSAKLFPAKSVLIAMYGATVGEVGINSTEATCNQAICVLKFVDLPFFYVFLYLKVEKQMILNQAVGSAQQNISQVLIKNFPLIKPNLNDVEEVFTKLRGIFNKIEQNIIENQTLTQLRNTLLPKLISGEVRLREFKEQTLSVL